MRFLAVTLFGIYGVASSSYVGSPQAVGKSRTSSPPAPGSDEFETRLRKAQSAIAKSIAQLAHSRSGTGDVDLEGSASHVLGSPPSSWSVRASTRGTYGGAAGRSRPSSPVDVMTPPSLRSSPRGDDGESEGLDVASIPGFAEYMAATSLLNKRLTLKGAMETLNIPKEYIKACLVALIGNSGEAEALMGVREFNQITDPRSREAKISELRARFSAPEYDSCFAAIDKAIEDEKPIMAFIQSSIATAEREITLGLDGIPDLEDKIAHFLGLYWLQNDPIKRQIIARWDLSQEHAARLMSEAIFALPYDGETRVGIIKTMMKDLMKITKLYRDKHHGIQHVIMHTWGLSEDKADNLMELAAVPVAAE
jgi:hypothetical protein